MDKPITNDYELFDEIRLLVQRAERGGLTGPHVHALRTIGEQIMTAIQENHRSKAAEVNHDDRRDSFRFAPQDRAVAVVEGERIEVTILDLGGRGVGIFSPKEISSGSYLMLEILGDGQKVDVYSSYAAFCRQKEAGYRVGLRLFAKLPS
ncbi:MAG: PilZ domain-containing protein [Magnetococcales bacterium]|nr:PilZ domain-containing protein [Magnetococcales bacterium]